MEKKQGMYRNYLGKFFDIVFPEVNYFIPKVIKQILKCFHIRIAKEKKIDTRNDKTISTIMYSVQKIDKFRFRLYYCYISSTELECFRGNKF